MRVGLIGAGAMGSTHAAAWKQTGAQLAGLFDTKGEQASALASLYQTRTYTNLDTLLQDVDIVDICTPTHLHHDMVLQAAAAGKHVVCEKPLGRTLAQGQAMVQACRDAGVALLVGQVVRFFPEYAAAQREVAAGHLGDVAVVRLKRNVFRPRKAQDNWFLDRAKSGGMILDLMIHDFDYARWISGEVVAVFARQLGDAAQSVGDHCLAILTHASGAISHVEGSWAYPPPTFRTQFEIAGSAGLLIHNSAATAPLSVLWRRQGGESAGEVPLAASPLLESPYTTEIRAFYEHIVHGSPVPVSAVDGLAALQIALAVSESAQTGAVVHLSPLPEVAR
jgi:predicted dehydrogenase